MKCNVYVAFLHGGFRGGMAIVVAESIESARDILDRQTHYRHYDWSVEKCDSLKVSIDDLDYEHIVEESTYSE